MELDKNVMSPFSRFVGGEWHTEGSYQVFEWGVGKLSVKARSYFLLEGEAKLVSEGAWFWHPGESAFRGYFTAIDMPVVLFDYTTRFKDGKMVSKLRSYAPDGTAEDYLETIESKDENHTEMTLFSQTPDGPQAIMSLGYRRKT